MITTDFDSTEAIGKALYPGHRPTKGAALAARKAKAAPPPPVEPPIANSYLMWIGSDSYPKIEDWTAEAVEMGVSKRLPSIEMGRSLMDGGTIIFVAHDEGETSSCSDCHGYIECPDCRKRAVERATLEGAIAAVVERYPVWADAPPGDLRFVELRTNKIAALDAADAACPMCGGTAQIETGTGGSVTLDDGSIWDYRRYNYWLHQPAKWDPSGVVEKHMCPTCGGTGERPDAKVFGAFIPERIEYILAPEDVEDEEKLDAVRGMELITTEILETEKKRGCGYRKRGGTYAVTSTKGVPAKARAALDELVEKGLVKPEGAHIHGSFIRLEAPIMVAEKRFRGLKRIDLSILTAASEEAEAIVSSMD